MKRLSITLALLFAAVITMPSLAQRGGWDPGEFLSRMDKNKNGVLERGEIDGRAEGWLKRYDSNLNFDKGVKIDKLKKKISESRERRDRDRRRDNDDDDDDDNDEQIVGIDVLVAGFGENVELPPVINFGSTPENYVEVTDANRRRARDTMGRYDRNKDGQLDRNERNRNSRWIGEPMQYDANRDDKLSLQEMSTRYAHLDRIESEKKASRDSGRDRGDRRRRRGDDDEEVTVEVIRGGGPGSGYTTNEERLPDGLPDWFAEKDKNADGQLSMAEFLTEVTTEEVAKFTSQDADNDGLLVAAELGVEESTSEKSKERGATSERRSRDRSDKVTKKDLKKSSRESRGGSDRTAAVRSSSGKASGSAGTKTAEKKPEKSAAEVEAKYQSYAAGRVKKYDANRDGFLSVEECKAGKPGLQEADYDGNGKITTEEVAKYYQRLYKR